MLTGCVAAAAVVLAIAGVAKLAKPAVTAEAIRAARLPSSAAAVTALGFVELVLGVSVAVWSPRPGAGLLAAFYVGFALFSWRLLIVRGPSASCGCFGQRDAPIGVEHVAVNLVVAVLAGATAAGVGGGGVDPVATVVGTVVLLALLAGVPVLRARRG